MEYFVIENYGAIKLVGSLINKIRFGILKIAVSSESM